MIRRLLSFIAAAIILFTFVSYAVTVSAASAVKIPDGAVAVWEVSDLGTKTPVYTDNDGKLANYYVDKPNSAYMSSYLPYGKVILDHQNSNINGCLWNVGKITIDSTARFVTNDKTEEYVCYLVCRAKMTGAACYMIGWNVVKPESENDILCASCASTDEVYLACFRLVRSW